MEIGLIEVEGSRRLAGWMVGHISVCMIQSVCFGQV
jgi:hypothetical protein